LYEPSIDWAIVLDEMEKYSSVFLNAETLIQHPELIECAASPHIVFLRRRK